MTIIFTYPQRLLPALRAAAVALGLEADGVLGRGVPFVGARYEEAERFFGIPLERELAFGIALLSGKREYADTLLLVLMLE